MRTWQVERRKRTRHLIELGGLVVKAGIVDLTGDDRAMIYGAMIWIADKLKSEDGEHARGVWTKLGKMTEAGRLFVERVSVGVDHLDHAVKAAGMAASGECGRLRIGIHALIPRSFLADLIAQYREAHPGIEVEITEGTARDTVMQLRADRLDIVFVAGAPELPDCHSRCIWTEPLMAVLPEWHRLAGQSAVTWVDLTDETFLVRHGSTGPQVHDHILLRLAGLWSAPSILRFDVGRGTLLSMAGQGFGITIIGGATSLLPTSGVIFLPFADEPEPVPFSAIWSPYNQSAMLRNLLDLARRMGRSVGKTDIRPTSK